MLKKALAVSFFLYLVALLTSMAGMEIFGWLTFLLAMVSSLDEKRRNPGAKVFFPLGADWVVLALFAIVILGYCINAAPGTDFMFMIGNMRWAILMYGVAYAARSTKLTEKAFVPLMIVAMVVASHGIFEFFSAWDLIRNRRVGSYIGYDYQGRAAGFFSMPTTFAHAIVMTTCFPLAALFLRWAQSRWQRIAVMTAVGLLLIVLGMSFTRGAWISFLVALAAMTFMVNRKLFLGVILICLVSGAALIGASSNVRERASTLFDSNYSSNSERVELWRVNWWMFKEYPILGLGFNENETRAEEFNIKYGVPDAKVGNAHNNYLQFLSGTGILGFTAYMAFIGFYLWLALKLWKVIPKDQVWHRVVVLGAFGAQISLHVGGFTDCNFKDAEVQHQFITILALLSYLRFAYLKNGGAIEASSTTAGQA